MIECLVLLGVAVVGKPAKDDSGDSGPCFISIADYTSYRVSLVHLLSDCRDDILLINARDDGSSSCIMCTHRLVSTGCGFNQSSFGDWLVCSS